jgi:hypothetical protein
MFLQENIIYGWEFEEEGSGCGCGWVVWGSIGWEYNAFTMNDRVSNDW